MIQLSGRPLASLNAFILSSLDFENVPKRYNKGSKYICASYFANHDPKRLVHAACCKFVAASYSKVQDVVSSCCASEKDARRDFAKKGVGKVFATDSLIATLMCATRSVYSWDIIIERQGDFLFLDKRDGSSLDMLTGNLLYIMLTVELLGD